MSFKIYTKTGDKGTTSLFGGGKVSKAHRRVQAYGEVDELNAIVGILRTLIEEEPLSQWLRTISSWLFILGSDLATPMSGRPTVQRLSNREVDILESWIDQLEATLPPLRNFILPGGTSAAAYCHLARTVCRRAERSIVALAEQEAIGHAIIPFVNRLSDFFFVAARWHNHQHGIDDEPWDQSSGSERRS